MSDGKCNFGNIVKTACGINNCGGSNIVYVRPVKWRGIGQAVSVLEHYPKMFPSGNDFIPTLVHITAEWEIVSPEEVLAER